MEEERVKVVVPVGVEEGTALRIPGHGMPAPDAAGLPGDAYVIVTTSPDPRFLRRGVDLWRSQEVDVVDAVLGRQLDIPSLEGPISVVVEPGTQPGAVLRLSGMGLPSMGQGGRGDLNVVIEVRIPQHLSNAQRVAWEQLRALAAGSGTEGAHVS